MFVVGREFQLGCNNNNTRYMDIINGWIYGYI